MRRLTTTLLTTALLAVISLPAKAQEQFSKLVGPVKVGNVADQATLQVPFITWGGDVATFYANGGLETKPGSIYANQNLNIKLSPGDDFVQQVRDYTSGKSPFLRGTMRMLGQASEVIASDPRTKPVIILQLSWSAGDHIVSRNKFKSLNDLKLTGTKAKIACQQGGPHVGLLYDALDAAKLSRDDVEIVFVKDLTGPDGPADAFRNDSSIDACCVITPDMIGLTGGLDSEGTGAEGSVEGARVLVSTQNMSRSVADVYAVRSDWYKANTDTVKKFVAGYLAGTNQVVKMRDDFEKNQSMSAPYRSLLAQSQSIFGEEVLPTLEVDAHGLLLDCRFVGLPGQIAFFQQSGNLSGFDAKLAAALDMATQWGYASARYGFDKATFDYLEIAKTADIEYKKPEMKVAAEGVDLFPNDDLNSETLVSFTINFEPNQNEFSSDRYGAEFKRALQSASTFGGAAVVIRGHSDPTKTLVTLLKAGTAKGLITRTGASGNYKYFIKTDRGSQALDLENMEVLTKLIKTGSFEGGGESPMQTMQAAMNLSLSRADAVKQAIVDYAQQSGINVNVAQLAPIGAGISDPLISKPSSIEEAMQNMRVEFRIVKVAPETLQESDFDF